VHVELVTSATTQWNEYLMVGGSMIGVRFLQGTSVTLRYFHQDHLGSIAVLTDASGAVVERNAYDPWDKRRFTNGSDDPTNSIVSQTIRGFTGQEMLASVGLVHLNGRVYDPYVGRMTSADPVVGDPLNGQTWNRYSYVYNNPLAFTDPTGYCPLCLGNFFSRVFNGIQKFLQRNPLVGQVLVIASAAVCGPNAPLCAGIAATVSTFVVTGLTTGRLDMALKAAAITAATAAAFYGIGEMTSELPGAIPIDGAHGTFVPFSEGHIANIVGHALVGCGAALAGGGKCGAGALAGAVGSAAGPYLQSMSFQARLVIGSTLGGLASIAGGGKFANGAVTAAFGYLFNEIASCAKRGYCQGLSYQTVRGGPDQNPWAIQWDSQPSPADGWIIQEVTITLGDRLIVHYWEAWGVVPGSTQTWYADNGDPQDDTWRTTAPGTTTFTGTARFYEGQQLPDSFVLNNQFTPAGTLPSTTENPNLPIINATDPVNRASSITR
jgi:RHS repeat-associated protein